MNIQFSTDAIHLQATMIRIGSKGTKHVFGYKSERMCVYLWDWGTFFLHGFLASEQAFVSLSSDEAMRTAMMLTREHRA